MRSRDEVAEHLAQLSREVMARAQKYRYAGNSNCAGVAGLSKLDCGLVLTSLGGFLGFQVMGKSEWRSIVLPGQENPATDGGEIVMPYPGTEKGRADYAWLDAGRLVAVFEVDGRDNDPSVHLPIAPREGSGRAIKQHIRPNEARNFATNNLFSLSARVLRAQLGYVPPIRAWVLFQVDNPPMFTAKNPWKATPANWRAYFAECDELSGAMVFGDCELFSESFAAYVLAGIEASRQ